MNQVRPACGLPFFSDDREEQTKLSIGLRIIEIVLGVLAAVVGVLILLREPNLSHFGTTVGWTLFPIGVFLVALGVTLKFVKPGMRLKGRNAAKTQMPAKKTHPKTQITDLKTHTVNIVFTTPPKSQQTFPSDTVSADPTILNEARMIIEPNPWNRTNPATLFKQFFDLGDVSEQRERIQKLGDQNEGVEVLNSLSQYFSQNHWSALSDNQFLAMDLVKILPSLGRVKQAAFMLSITNGDEKYRRLTLLFDQRPEAFYVVIEFLSLAEWRGLIVNQENRIAWARNLNFSRMSQSTLNKVFVFLEIQKLIPTFGVEDGGLAQLFTFKKHWGVTDSSPGNWLNYASKEQAIAITKNFEKFTKGFDDNEKALVRRFLGPKI